MRQEGLGGRQFGLAMPQTSTAIRVRPAAAKTPAFPSALAALRDARSRSGSRTRQRRAHDGSASPGPLASRGLSSPRPSDVTSTAAASGTATSASRARVAAVTNDRGACREASTERSPRGVPTQYRRRREPPEWRALRREPCRGNHHRPPHRAKHRFRLPSFRLPRRRPPRSPILCRSCRGWLFWRSQLCHAAGLDHAQPSGPVAERCSWRPAWAASSEF